MEILIVEDDYISRMMLKKMLTEMGYPVVETENGRQAWELMQQEPIQIVVTDCVMPELDGLGLCRNIRNASFDDYIYIIMLTAKDDKKNLLEVFQAGADDFIPKPFDPEEFRARVLTGLRIVGLEQRHKRLQGNLLGSRNKLRILLDSLQEEIVALSPGFKIESVNRSFAERIGESVDEIIGKSFDQLGDSAAKTICIENIRPLVEKTFGEGKIRHHLYTAKDEAGLSLYKQFVCLPVKDEAGQVIQVIVVAKDISEERRRMDEIHALNTRLTAAGAQLEAKNRSLKATLKQLETTQAQMLQSEKMASIGQLAAGVAHEINNPTGFVNSNLKTLNDYQLDINSLIAKYHDLMRLLQTPAVAEQIGRGVNDLVHDIQVCEKDIDIDFVMSDMGDLIGDCREGTERIKKIVLDLKDFAHPGEDKQQSVDINKGLASTLNVVNNEIKYKATVETDFGDIPIVQGFPQQLNQVFMNILVNAAQAIERDGRISVKTQLLDGYVAVTISDSGCGIPKEHISKIFDPFFTTKEVGKGTGLGMNIAYNIVQKHNGAIEVQSEAGKGTTFMVRLPVAMD